MTASDVSLAAGCAVIKALSPNRCIDVHLSGNTLRRGILRRYWTVVQHRAGSARSHPLPYLLRNGGARPGLVLRANVAPLILLTEYDPAWHHGLNVNQSSSHLNAASPLKT